jgi:mono/diheme cytochrome c family protein
MVLGDAGVVPDSAAGTADAGTTDAGTTAPAPRLADLSRTIFAPHCLECHRGDPGTSLGLRLDDGDGGLHDRLLTGESIWTHGERFVVLERPAESYLLLAITPRVDDTVYMPKDIVPGFRRALTDDERSLIVRWIEAGAPE